MSSAPHTYDPPPVSWYGPPDVDAHAIWDRLTDEQRARARATGITAAEAAKAWRL